MLGWLSSIFQRRSPLSSVVLQRLPQVNNDKINVKEGFGVAVINGHEVRASLL